MADPMADAVRAIEAPALRGRRGVDLTVWPPRYDPAYRPPPSAEHWLPEGTLPRTEFKARRVSDDRDLYHHRHHAEGSSDERLREGAKPQTGVIHIQPR